MLPSGRRRAGALSPLTTMLALLLLFTSTASAAVLGIDFGTLNIKAALVKPGIPLDIVLTKDSKRKESAALAFKPTRDDKNNIVVKEGSFPERAYGGDALALQGRMPGEVFPNLKQLLGISGDRAAEKVATYKQRYPAVQAEHVEALGTTVFKSAAFPSEHLPYSVEELVGMELANIKRNAELMAGKGSSVNDAVITIPNFYTADEKRAIVHAAYFAGFNVLGLISDGLAVGLDYAKTRTFPDVSKGETPEYHLVFDMGAGSTTASVLRFQSKSVKDVGKFNKTIQEVTVQGVGWDRTLGGDALNHVILDDFVAKLMAKSEVESRGTTEAEVRSNGRVMARFWKEAERVRQVLSANSDTSAGFEEILPDIDLRVKLSRAEFEKLTADYAKRVTTPLEDALKMAKLTSKDLKSVILHGGAIRTPFVQSQLEAVVDDKAKLRSNVNPDESAVFGAAFKAASLSPSFKVKEIRDSEAATYAASLVYQDNGKERKQGLFTPQSPAGAGATIKQVTFKDREDFAFGFTQSVEGADRPILEVKVENLTASVDQLKSKFSCEKDDMIVRFGVKLNANFGLPDVVSGSVGCEVEDVAKSGGVGDSVKGWLGLGKKKDQEPLTGEDDTPVEDVSATPSSASGSSSASSSSSGSKETASSPPKTRVEVVMLKFSTSPQGNPQPDAAQVQRLGERLKEFDASDRARTARDEAQNVLESYTYSVRDFLENADFSAVSTKAQREEISKLLQTTKDWMESGEPGKAATEVLKEKYQALKNLVDPIKARRTENAQRATLVPALQKSLDKAKKSIAKYQDKIEKAKASLTASSSSTTSAPTAASSDVDDLEEPDTSSAPEPEASKEPSPLLNLDMTSINSVYDEITTWLSEKVAEQGKLKPFEDPVLLVKDLERRSTELKDAVDDLVRRASVKPTVKKPPKPKASPKPKPSKKAESDDAAPAEPEPADTPEADGEKPVKGGESIEDMMDWLNKAKDKQKDAEVPPRDEL
ncbi:putative Heat shock protein 70 family [Septoria linicola]|nr:putative Heat shock protein 70 family [Septoria linicola]